MCSTRQDAPKVCESIRNTMKYVLRHPPDPPPYAHSSTRPLQLSLTSAPPVRRAEAAGSVVTKTGDIENSSSKMKKKKKKKHISSYF